MKKILITIMTMISFFSFAKNEASDIKLVDYNTNKVKTVSEFKGKTYVKLWASWCPTCLYTLKDVEELSKEKLDFNVITVISPEKIGEQTKADFKEWWNGLNDYKNVKIYFDEEGAFIKKARVRGYPTNVFINSKGEIEKVLTGAMSNKRIKEVIKGLK
ncbi:redoxin family protein [Oceanivirga salmonicida]|uniref:redoxin family protein n=1 Tax=Oceanivirga salmonicida TaxID=1769291 RepID=UPI00082F019C|nr:redoxin family protein [Oceanivirga salmonicida]